MHRKIRGGHERRHGVTRMNRTRQRRKGHMPIEQAIEHGIYRSAQAQADHSRLLLQVSHNTFLDRAILAEEEESGVDMSGYQAWDDVSGSSLDPQLVR